MSSNCILPKSRHTAEHPATTGTLLSPHYPQPSTQGPYPPSGSNMKRAKTQKGYHDGHESHSSSSFLQPGVSDPQGRSSRPSTRTSSEVHGGSVTTQPIPLETLQPFANENRRGEWPTVHEPPPPGLRGEPIRRERDHARTREQSQSRGCSCC